MLNIHQSPSRENRGFAPARPIPAHYRLMRFPPGDPRGHLSPAWPPVLTDVNVALDRAHNIHQDARRRRQRAASFGDEAIVEREPPAARREGARTDLLQARV